MDNKIRCKWCLKDDLYIAYHDNEWGKPSFDDHHLFEMMLLESFQAGLSWYTILSKRENFKAAFSNFNVKKVAKYNAIKIEELMQNSGIIKNRLKIMAAIANAQKFIELQKEFGSFSNYIWQFSENKIIDYKPKLQTEVLTSSKLSESISKDLKKRNFKFMGNIICYAYLQSIGMINDHVVDCYIRN